MTAVRPARVLGAGEWYEPAGQVLLGAACGRCATASFPPRAFCWRCGSPMRPAALPRTGRVVARSRVRVAPPGFPACYDVGVVQLLADLHVMARFAEQAPNHGEVVTVRTAAVRLDGDEQVLGPVWTADPASAPPEVPRDTGALGTGYQPLPGPRLGIPVAGVATTAFGRPDVPAEHLAGEAALAAVRDAGLSPDAVDAVVVGSAFSTAALGQRMLRHVPWGGRRLVNVENACASGTSALAEAVSLIRSGLADVVVAVGADAPVRAGGGLIPLDRDDPVAGIGVTLPALYAMVADSYRTRYRVSEDAFAEVVVRSRAAAAQNPDAFRRDPLDRAAVLAARPVADPLTLFECAPNADGAAAAVLVSESVARQVRDASVRLEGLALHTGLAKDRFTGDSVVGRVARAAFRQAGAGPEDVGVVELHDAFAPAALTGLEALGLAEPGTAAGRLLAGGFAGAGTGPVLNPSGGLLSRGHPPGATGLAQLAELVRQLRGEAGGRQVPDPGVALLHTMGGTVLELETNACAVGVLRRAS